MDIQLRLLAVPTLKDNYVWLLADTDGRAIAVDPGEAAPVEAALQRERLELTGLLLTHHHPDHVGGARELAASRTLEIYAPRDARIEIDALRVGEGDVARFARPALAFDVLEVHGHTKSHIAFHGHGIVFSGDTLFSVGCGHPFEGTPAELQASLERLAALPGDTQVCCGHEYTLTNCAFARTVDPANAALIARQRAAQALRANGEPTLPVSIAEERATNPFLRVDEDAIIAALPDARGRAERFAELRRRKDVFKADAA